MKKYFQLVILICSWIIVTQSHARDISFVSSPADTLDHREYVWQSGNSSRPIIPLDGVWEYRIREKDPWKNVVLPAHTDYLGEITFRKSFVPDSVFTAHYFRLVCYGINHYSMIFINNKFISSHSSGYNSFYLNIAENVIKVNQKNVIEIKVDTRLDARKTIPQKFQMDGVKATQGVFRSLYFLALPEFSIEKASVMSRLSHDYGECDIDLSLELKDRIDNAIAPDIPRTGKSGLECQLELLEQNNPVPVVVQTAKIPFENYQLTRTVEASLKLKQPRLWSPEAPHLYALKIQLLNDKQVLDESMHTFGVRDLQLAGGNIALNGQRIVLKGINWYEDYATAGALLDRHQLYAALSAMKHLNANAVRVVNHPPHPMFTALCDSLGLIVLQDIPVQWVPPQILDTDLFRKHSIDYLNEIIARDGDHVSVLGWGFGGGFYGVDPHYANYISKVLEETQSNHLFYLWNTPSNLPPVADTSLIHGLSVFGLKRKKIEQAIPVWLRQNRNEINLVLSYGAPKLATPFSGNDNVLYEEYQVLQLVEAWQTINSHPEIDGYFLSSLSDYYGNYPSGNYGPSGDFFVRPTGLTDLAQKTRIAYETIRSLYQEGKCRYNPGVEIKTDSPGIFPIVGILVLLILLFMINTRRYFRENFKRIFIHPHGFYVDMRDGRKIPPTHTLFMALFVATGSGMVLSSMLYFFNAHPHIDHLLTLIAPGIGTKTSLSELSWQPGWATFVFALLTLASFLVLSLIIKLTAIIIGKRFPLSQALTLPIWVSAHYLICVILGMILFRVFQIDGFIAPIFLIIAALHAWFIFRLIRAIRVIYTWSFIRSLLFLIFVFGIIFVSAYYYYQHHSALWDYVNYYYQLYGNTVLSTFVM
ncbi:MAG: glycoside hydrolase family 2 TIM barrel-domain containing protein [Candidatus Zhuqueibacterota bacterium]